MARKGKKHRSNSQVQQFLAYQSEFRQEKNKIKAVSKHIKNHPEDTNAIKALSRIKVSSDNYKRKSGRVSNFEPKRTPMEAYVNRQLKTGAVIVHEGKTTQKPEPRTKREKISTDLLSQLLNIRGEVNSRGKFSKRMR